MSTKKQSYDAVVASESDLLDALEARVGLINQNAKVMNQEVKVQNKMLNHIQNETTQTKTQLYTEAENIQYARTMKEDYCWMYVVITAEIFIILFLLWMGFR